MPERVLSGARRHAIGIAVAAGVVALSLPNGAYYPRASAIAALVVWWVVLVGCAAGLLPRARIGRGALVFLGLLAAFALWSALSLAWSYDDGRGYAGVVRGVGYTGLAACVLAGSRRGGAREWLAGLAAGTSVVVVLALASRYFPNLFDSGRDEIANRLDEASGRLAFPLGYWNALAGIAAVNALLLAGFSVGAATRSARAALAGLIVLPMLAIFLTSSRGGVISLAIGAAVLFVLARRRERWLAVALPPLAAGAVLIAIANGSEAFTDDLGNSDAVSQGAWMLLLTAAAAALAGAAVYLTDPRVRAVELGRSLRARHAAAGLAVAIAIGAAVFFAVGPFDTFKELPSTEPGQATNGAGHLVSSGSSGRWQFWSTAEEAFSEQPLKGLGEGSYPAYWEQHGEIAVSVQNAHSLVMETLAELGLVGVLLLFGFLLAPLLAGLRRWRAQGSAELAVAIAVFAAVVAQALSDWAWQVPALFSTAVVAAAVMAGPAGEPGGGTSVPARPRWTKTVAIVAALLALACAGVQLAAETKIEASRSALARGDAAGALEDADDAISVEPFAAEPRLRKALALEASGDLEGAKAAIKQAIDRADRDWTLWFVAARIARDAGDHQGAFLARSVVRQLNPPVPSGD